MDGASWEQAVEKSFKKKCPLGDGRNKPMNVTPQNPRSIFAALLLMIGWIAIILGAFILITGGKEGLESAFSFLVTGAVLVGLIYYRERSQRAERCQQHRGE